MTNLVIGDLLNLVASKVPEPESRLEKVFECEHARQLEMVKWLLALAAALFAAVAVGEFRGASEPKASPIWMVITLSLAAAITIFGLIMLIRGRRMYRTYLAAQTLLGEINKISPFIERYRQELEQE